MSKSDLSRDLEMVKRSLKKYTSSDCPYEVSEKTSKKFNRLKQRADLSTRLIMQAGIDIYQDAYFDEEITLEADGGIKEAIFQNENPSRAFFNKFLFKILSKKDTETTYKKKFEKLEKRKKKLNKGFQEIAYREEFFFEKLTTQIVDRYRKTFKPHEFQILDLIFDFQNDLRLFNWQIVNKDVQIEFLFNIFTLLQVKQNLINSSKLDMLGLEKELKHEIPVPDERNSHPVIFELLYLLERLNVIQFRVKKIEKQFFGEHTANTIKRIKKKADVKARTALTAYIKQLKSLNDVMNKVASIETRGTIDKLKGDVKALGKELLDILKDKTRVGKVPDDKAMEDAYQEEYYLVGFIVTLFRKIFGMLKKKRTMTDLYVIKRLLTEIVKHDKGKIAILMLAVFLNALIGMIMPLILGELVDYLNVKNPQFSDVENYGYFFLGIGVSSLVLSIVSNWIIQFLGNKVMYEMREKMYNNLQKLSFDYYNIQPSGKIISYVTNDIETIQQLISSGFLTVFIDVFRLVGSVFLMISISWELTLTSFMIIPFILIGAGFIFQKARRYFVILRRKIAGVTTHLQESTAGMRVIKSFAIEDKDYDTFNRANQENLEINLKSAKLFSALPGLITAVVSLGIAVLILVGGWLYIQSVIYATGEFNIGKLLSFLLYLFQFFGPIIAMVAFVTNIQNSMAAGERVVRLVDAESSVKERPNAVGMDSKKFKNVNRGNVKITFENVNFEYEKSLPILKNISLETKPKERLAIVGYTGAGKSTFIKLISRFWDVTNGRIMINNIDIKKFKFKALRELMGIVLQDNFLFSGTVLDNIKYGKPEASIEEVHTITKKLGIHEFILNMEEGYDTPVRERGSRLSAGQKQLIAFARALLVDPPILILDEATSSIDPYSEIIVKRALDTLLKNRTSITIAHRLSTVLNSDRILVMEKGEIVESGSHHELVKKDGLYKHLFDMQFTKIKN